MESWSPLRITAQVLDRPTRDEALPDLVLINAEEIIIVVKIRGSLGCSDCDLVKFGILRNKGLAKSVVMTMNFSRADF